MLKKDIEEENQQLKEKVEHLENLLMLIWEKLQKFMKGSK